MEWGIGKCVNETPAVELTAEKETTLRLEIICNYSSISYLSPFQLQSFLMFIPGSSGIKI